MIKVNDFRPEFFESLKKLSRNNKMKLNILLPSNMYINPYKDFGLQNVKEEAFAIHRHLSSDTFTTKQIILFPAGNSLRFMKAFRTKYELSGLFTA